MQLRACDAVSALGNQISGQRAKGTYQHRDVLAVYPNPTRPAGHKRRLSHARATLAVHRSLSFLSKKTWHTTNLKNVEKVWLAEQEQEKEKQKLEKWKKEREEEKQQAELRALQDEMTKTCAPPSPTHGPHR